MNAGLYLFATVMLAGGVLAQLSKEPRSGLVLILIAVAFIMVVNLHDLVAHLAGIDYRLPLVGFDIQLALVEFAVPLVQTLGAILLFLGILFIFLQEEKGYGYFKLEKHAMRMLVAGPALWVLGSVHNSCQIYETADGHTQILQMSVHLPFLMGSLLFLVASSLNIHEQAGWKHHGLELLGRNWIWMGTWGSLLFFLGGSANVVKVFRMQQTGGLRLEKLRGGTQERLVMAREGQAPLIPEEHRWRRRIAEKTREAPPVSAPLPTPYKDVLLGQKA